MTHLSTQLAYEERRNPRAATVEPAEGGARLVHPPDSVGSKVLTLVSCGAGAFFAATITAVLWFTRPHADIAWWSIAFLGLLLWAVVGYGAWAAVRHHLSPAPRRLFLTRGDSPAAPSGEAGRVRRVNRIEVVRRGWVSARWAIAVSATKTSGKPTTVIVATGLGEGDARRAAAEIAAALGL